MVANSTQFIQTFPVECTDGDLRLVDGRARYEGRVEVCQEGLWGSVCDDNWLPRENSIVVCRQAGINTYKGKNAGMLMSMYVDYFSLGVLFGTFGAVSGPIHLSSVFCIGTEASLFDCFHFNNHLENIFCYPSEPVGVICIPENETGPVF